MLVPAAQARAARYKQVDQLLVERNSQRSIVRATGVARMTVAKRAKKGQAICSSCPEPTSEAAELEWDELWASVGRRKHKGWRWLAVERATRRIVTWVLGCRGAATARRLWQAFPTRYQQHTIYYTDKWEAYAKVLPRAAHRPTPKGSGASIVEALNCSLRQRYGVLVRKSCSFSKLQSMHQVRIQLCSNAHNLRLTKI